MFDNPLYFNIYKCYVDKYFKTNISNFNFTILKEKVYFFKLLCFGSIFWVNIAISCLNIESVPYDGFDYLNYSIDRLKIYEAGIMKIKSINE